jgi:hypothetical protein
MYGSEPYNIFDQIANNVYNMAFIDSIVFNELSLREFRITNLYLVADMFADTLI